MNYSGQKGVAVIMVLLIVAIATTLATYMAQQQSLWQRQVESQFARTQARYLGVAGVDWARAVLADDASSSKTDHAKEMWTLRLPAIPVEGGEVIGAIEDRQGLFNLNNVARNGVSSAPDVAQFQRLLDLLGLPAELAPALADWIDADSEAQHPDGAEDMYYLSIERPYRTANRPLAELGELVRVKGYNANIISHLQPFVSVLPASASRTPVNVNFAPPEVLAAVLKNMTLSDARSLAHQRSEQPFKDGADFKDRLKQFGGIQVVDSDISVSSQFFWVTGHASVGQAQVTTHALLQRVSNWPTVVWQSVQ